MNSNVVIFIHGAYSTGLSFTYLKQGLGENRPQSTWTYDWNDREEVLCEDLAYEICRVGGSDEASKVDLVGHSLGGVLAMALQSIPPVRSRTRKIVTLSSPLGGVEVARYLKWLYFREELFNTIHPGGKLANAIRNTNYDHVERMHIVTTGGESPVFKHPNDGVVSVASQMAKPGGEVFKMDINHFEVLLNPGCKNLIAEFLK